MAFRLSLLPLLCAVCLSWIAGCTPTTERPVSADKNPFFLEGRARATARDFPRAIAAYERALQDNPNHVEAHYELGLIYEVHSQQSERDFINALYHYQRAMDLRTNAYPYDNARVRLAACKRELVKTESVAPVYAAMQNELEDLRKKNKELRDMLAANTNAAPAATVSTVPGKESALPAGSPTRFPLSNSIVSSAGSPGKSSAPAGGAAGASLTNRTPASTASRLPAASSRQSEPARSYVVRRGDTIYSIARQHNVSSQALIAANPGLNPKRMAPGQVVRIPVR